jgi:hypothetical protein
MEGLSLHMDMQSRTVTPFPEDIAANLAVMKAAHARLARPQALSAAPSGFRRGATRWNPSWPAARGTEPRPA